MLRAFPSRVLALGAALTLVTTAGHAQSNTIPGLDVSLSGLGGISMTGAAHSGVFPNGFGGGVDVATGTNSTTRGRLSVGDSGDRFGWNFDVVSISTGVVGDQ